MSQNNIISFRIRFEPIGHYTYIDSIKLNGALLNTLLMLYDNESDEIIESFKSGRTCSSSLFPYSTDFLYPINSLLFYIDENLPWKQFVYEMKKRKEVPKYMTMSKIREIFRIIMEKDNGRDSGFSIDKKKIESLLPSSELSDSIWIPEADYRESVRLNDPTGLANGVFTRDYYSYGSRFISEKRYLWFQINSDLGKDKIENSLKLLKEMGISGDRTVGGGEFDYKILSESNAENPNFKRGYHILLSKFIPSKEDLKILDIGNSAYRFEMFSGLYDYGKLGIYRYILPGAILRSTANIDGSNANISGVRIQGHRRILSFTPLTEMVSHEI